MFKFSLLVLSKMKFFLIVTSKLVGADYVIFSDFFLLKSCYLKFYLSNIKKNYF